MELKEELKNSKRYEYDETETTFNSHKYKSSIVFLDDVDMIEYIVYPDANPEGHVLFTITYDISLDKLEKIIDIVEG